MRGGVSALSGLGGVMEIERVRSMDSEVLPLLMRRCDQVLGGMLSVEAAECTSALKFLLRQGCMDALYL